VTVGRDMAIKEVTISAPAVGFRVALLAIGSWAAVVSSSGLAAAQQAADTASHSNAWQPTDCVSVSK
jgi:hypothetical protein